MAQHTIINWMPVIGDLLCLLAGWMRIPWGRTIFCVLVRRCAMFVAAAVQEHDVVVIIVGLACMAAITVMLIKTIWTGREGQFDPGRITNAGTAGKTSSGVKGFLAG